MLDESKKSEDTKVTINQIAEVFGLILPRMLIAMSINGKQQFDNFCSTMQRVVVDNLVAGFQVNKEEAEKQTKEVIGSFMNECGALRKMYSSQVPGIITAQKMPKSKIL